MVAGACSAVCATVVLCPVDRAKILLQVQRTEEEKARAEGKKFDSPKNNQRYYKGPMDVWREQKITGMYRGWLITAYREMIYGSIYFAVFEKFKEYAALALDHQQTSLSATGTSKGLPFGVLLVCGGGTGAVIWTAMFPFDGEFLFVFSRML